MEEPTAALLLDADARKPARKSEFQDAVSITPVAGYVRRPARGVRPASACSGDRCVMLWAAIARCDLHWDA